MTKKLTVKVPAEFDAEKTYIVTLILSDFLGIGVTIQLYDGRNYVIQSEDGAEIILVDAFFGRMKAFRFGGAHGGRPGSHWATSSRHS